MKIDLTPDYQTIHHNEPHPVHLVAARYANVGKASCLTSSAVGKPGRLTYLEGSANRSPTIELRCYIFPGVSKPSRLTRAGRGKARRLTYVVGKPFRLALGGTAQGRRRSEPSNP